MQNEANISSPIDRPYVYIRRKNKFWIVYL